MRSVRKMVLGVAVGMCALSVLSAPAYARTRPTHIFGKFVSSVTGSTKGRGVVTAMSLGIYDFTGPAVGKNSEGKTEYGPICRPTNAQQREEYEKKEKEADEVQDLTVTGEAKAGEHATLEQNLNFRNCIAYRSAGNTKEGRKIIGEKIEVKRFTLGIVFKSSHAAQLGEPELAAEILKGSIAVHAKGAECQLEIPAQYVPIKAGEERFKNSEFEAALYATEETPTETKKEKKLYGPIHDTLNIEAAFSKVETNIEFNGSCVRLGEPEAVEQELKKGVLDFELETEVRNGNLSFVPAPEA